MELGSECRERRVRGESGAADKRVPAEACGPGTDGNVWDSGWQLPPQSPPRQEEQAQPPVPAGSLPFSAHCPTGIGSTSSSNMAFDSHSLIRASLLSLSDASCVPTLRKC